MYFHNIIMASVLAFTGRSSGATIPTPNCQSSRSVDAATEFTLTYGFPLYPFRNPTIQTILQANGTNRFYHGRQLADSSFTQVVSPNVDTLYSSAVLDLSQDDIILEIPEVNDRYYVYAIYDVWGDNYVNLGTTSQSAAGKYRIRYSPQGSRHAGLELCSSINQKRGDSSDCDDIRGIINAVTPYGSMQPRYSVNTGNSTELAKIHSYENQSSLTKVPKAERLCRKIPALTMCMLNSSLSSDTDTQVMQLTARIAPYSPARNSSDQACVDANLKTAGIEGRIYKAQKGQNLQASFNKTQYNMIAVAESPLNSMDMGHNWTSPRSHVQGDFGSNYAVRESVATTGYLMLKSDDAIYPTYSSSDLSLSESQAYFFTFESKPPLNSKGFWSLTTYNAQHFLIPNDDDIYALGSRSNITYSDGSLVYENDDHADTSFELLIQPQIVQPPSNWTNNWIPAPPNGGDISLILRIYGPAGGVTNGSWKAPIVLNQNAITE